MKPSLEEAVHEVYPEAVERVAIETRLSATNFPQELPYTLVQIFERELPAEELPDHRPTRKKPL